MNTLIIVAIVAACGMLFAPRLFAFLICLAAFMLAALPFIGFATLLGAG